MKTINITASTTDAEIAALHSDFRDLATDWRGYAVRETLGDRTMMTYVEVDGIVVSYDFDSYAFAAPGPSEDLVELYGNINSIEDAVRVAREEFV